MIATDFMATAKDKLSMASEAGVRGELPVELGPDAVQDEPRKAAVTVLFTMSDGNPCILMIKRSASGGQHRTEWAFPGGIVEPSDPSLLAAALRETEEELGVSPELIDVWGPLPSVITGTGFEVWPFTGRLRDGTALVPEAKEVDDVAYFPVRVLTDTANRRSITLVRDTGERRWDAIAYDGRIVWGASARIINRVSSILTQD